MIKPSLPTLPTLPTFHTFQICFIHRAQCVLLKFWPTLLATVSLLDLRTASLEMSSSAYSFFFFSSSILKLHQTQRVKGRTEQTWRLCSLCKASSSPPAPSSGYMYIIGLKKGVQHKLGDFTSLMTSSSAYSSILRLHIAQKCSTASSSDCTKHNRVKQLHPQTAPNTIRLNSFLLRLHQAQ